MGGLLIVGFFLIMAGFGVLSWYLKRKRAQEMQVAARQLGFTYMPLDVEGLIGYPFRLFMAGDGRGLENILAGAWQGLPMREFDYWYYTESTDSNGGTSKSYHYFSCALTTIGAACPALTIAREQLFSWMADHLGMPDIEFELEAFNNAFNVKGPDRKFAYDFCDQRMMQWLLDAGSQFEYEVVGNQVLVYTKRLKPTLLVPLLGTLKGFVEKVPRVVGELYPLESGSPRAYPAPPQMPAEPFSPPPPGPMAV